MFLQRKPLGRHLKVPAGIGKRLLFEALAKVLLTLCPDVVPDSSINQGAAVAFGRYFVEDG